MKKLFCLYILLNICFNGFSQAGTPVSDFGNNGVRRINLVSSGYLYFDCIAKDSNGKILIEGNKVLLRLNPNGTIDQTFGDSGKVAIYEYININEVKRIAIDKCNRIVVAGNATFINPNTNYFYVLRFNQDGSIDKTFGNNGKIIYPVLDSYDNILSGLGIDGNNKIILGGYTDNKGNKDFSVIRLNENGSLDLTFNETGKKLIPVGTGEDIANNLIIDKNNRIVMVGKSFANQYYFFSAIRLSSNGTLDNSFNGNGKIIFNYNDGYQYNSGAECITEGENDTLIIGGSTKGSKLAVAKLNGSGALCSNFGKNGIYVPEIPIMFMGNALDIKLDRNKKIVITGSGDSFIVCRLNRNGSYDKTFNSNGKFYYESRYDYAKGLIIGNDGKLNIVLQPLNSESGLLRLNEDGSRDTAFDSNGFAKFPNKVGPEEVQDFVLDKKGRLLIACYSKSYMFPQFTSIIRMLPDGTLDPSFGKNGVFTPNNRLGVWTLKIAVDDSCRVYLASSLQDTYSTSELKMIMRLKSNGIVDSTFNNIGLRTWQHTGKITNIKVDNDGKIVLGDDWGRITRLNSDGSDDNTFFSGYGYSCNGSLSCSNGSPFHIDGTTIYSIWTKWNPWELVFSRIRPPYVNNNNYNFYTSTGSIITRISTYNFASDLLMDKTNRLVIGANVSNVLEDYDFGILALNSNGEFQYKTTIDVGIKSNMVNLVCDKNNNILAAGTTDLGFEKSFVITRVNSLGQYDNNFGTKKITTGECVKMQLDSNYIWMVGYLNSSIKIVKLRAYDFALNISATNGNVTRTPDKTGYNPGDKVTIRAYPNPGYEFAGWSGDVTGTTDSVVITMDSNKNITSNFVPFGSLIINAINGTVTRNPDKAVYSIGEVVTLSATPNTGYRFSGWSGDLAGIANPATITMNGSRFVTATFEPVYTLSVTAQNGTVIKNPDKAEYSHGEVVTLTVDPIANYKFTAWSGDLVGNENPVNVTMTSNKTISAIIELVSGIDELEEKQFKVYPNPVIDYLTIETIKNNVTIRIYSYSGMLVKELKANGNTKIDLSSFEKGMYLLQLTADADNNNFIFIKQ